MLNRSFSTTILFLVFLSCFAFAETHFVARITASQLNPATSSTATGTAVFTLTDDGLEFIVTVNGVSFTAAHIHQGTIGESGGVVRTLTNDFVNNTAHGVWRSTDGESFSEDLKKQLQAGNLYVNIHSAANPTGEIRGQILPASGTSLMANLTGDQQVNDVTTSAAGTASLLYTDVGVAFMVTVNGVTPTAAHFHMGRIGENGGVVRTITSDFTGNTAIGIWTPNDGEPLVDSLVVKLLTGGLYFNIHSAANPGGDIRGQVMVNGGIGFTANLDGDQLVPPVTSSGRGSAALTLTPAGLIFSITVDSVDFTAVHFHNAASGSNGSVVRTLSSDFSGSTARGIWRSGDSEPLTDQLITELLSGNIYINVHSAANPAGEIRGQVMKNSGTGFSSTINAAQHFAGIASAATGTGSFNLTNAGLEFNITLEGIDFTAVHFHKGEVGATGTVLRTLTSDFTGHTATGIWASTDGEPLDNSAIENLLQNKVYVNVHTAANPAGEIRGQVILSSGTAFSANFTGAQQPAEVSTSASGTGAFTLTPAGLQFAITLDNVTPTALHFHNAALGENGVVVRTLTSDFTGNSGAGLWSADDGETLSDNLRDQLIAGNIYVNVHTSANPAGEIRGQVLLNDGRGFSAKMDGSQLVPPVTTNASGTGAFSWTDAGLIFDATVDGVTFTAVHIHNAPPGVNGGVVRTLTSDFNGQTASGIWRESDSEALTTSLIGELMSGNLYVNVHSTANPTGEIRGNISAGVVTGIDPLSAGNLPDNFQLGQNYPNPFNPVTTIPFSLLNQNKVSLAVYDVLGKKVLALLSNESLPAGNYEITFDANSLASGVYFYRLKTNDVSLFRKMTLLR